MICIYQVSKLFFFSTKNFSEEMRTNVFPSKNISKWQNIEMYYQNFFQFSFYSAHSLKDIFAKNIFYLKIFFFLYDGYKKVKVYFEDKKWGIVWRFTTNWGEKFHYVWPCCDWQWNETAEFSSFSSFTFDFIIRHCIKASKSKSHFLQLEPSKWNGYLNIF